MKEMQTIAEFANKYNIKLEWVHSSNDNPWMTFPIPHASHYLCKLSRRPESGYPLLEVMEMYYSMGPAHKNPPTLEHLLNAIQVDAGAYKCVEGIYIEFCNELGFHPDKSASKEAFKWTEHFTNLAEAWLSEELLDELLYDTEPL